MIETWFDVDGDSCNHYREHQYDLNPWCGPNRNPSWNPVSLYASNPESHYLDADTVCCNCGNGGNAFGSEGSVCTANSDCDSGLFCAVECFNGHNCPAGHTSPYCQPCSECDSSGPNSVESGFSCETCYGEATSGEGGTAEQTQACNSHLCPMQWRLAMNVHPSDGHNFGWGRVNAAEGWPVDGVSVGSIENALTADFMSSAVWSSDANQVFGLTPSCRVQP